MVLPGNVPWKVWLTWKNLPIELSSGLRHIGCFLHFFAMKDRMSMETQQNKDFTGSLETPLSSDWLLLTQERFQLFAEATEDYQWIHTDPERAQKEGPFGSTVAHGFLILSLFSHFMTTAGTTHAMRMGVNYGLNRVRFVAPVPAGSRIRAHFKLVNREALPALADLFGEQLTWEVVIEREGSEKPACVAEWITRRYI